MCIEHVAVFVADLAGMRDFYVAWFGGVAGERYHNPRTGLESVFLRFGDGCRLELMARPDVAARGERQAQVGYTHLAFCVGDETAVDALTARLEAAGHRVVSGPRRTGDGYYESCVLDPEGNVLELVSGS